MSRSKLVLSAVPLGLARRLEAAFVELLVPAAQAVALFQAGEAWRVEAYYDEEPDLRALRRHLRDLVEAEVPACSMEPVPDENWVVLAQAALPPVHVGRFTVHGSHDRGRLTRGPNTIEIDAGEAFGTAHHATTYGCLLAIGELGSNRNFRRMLDLGCGSGVLAIAMARVRPHGRVEALDVDPDAVRVAAANARINGVMRRMSCRLADGRGPSPGHHGRPYDFVVANILAGPLVRLAPQLARAVAPGGALVLSGLLVDQAPGVGATYVAHGFSLLRHRREAGWSTLTLLKRRPLPRPAHCGRA